MSLRARLWIYLGVVHAALAAGLIWQREMLGWWLFPLEIAILLTLFLGLRLTRAALEPLAFARTLSDIVRSGEYGSRYPPVGHNEIDQLVDTYNLMLSNLQNERLRLGEQRGFLERFLEVTPVGIVIFDFDDRIAVANPRAMELLSDRSRSELTGRSLGDIESPVAGELGALAVDEARMITDAAGRRLRCQRGEFHDRGFPRSYILVEELTAELNRSERATYEKLIRMISHEVTNTVAATNSLLESCLNYAAQIASDEHRADYENALRVLIARNRSLNEFTRSLGDIVRLPEPHLQDVDLHDLTEAMRTMFKPELERRNIALAVRVHPDLPPAAIDRNQIEQVMINVIKNAIEAIDRDGHIEVSASHDAGVIAVSVVDDGVGLDAESKKQLFTPFYSSKREGQGLGLTLVKEVLTKHGFGFSLETRDGRTRFQIRIPSRPAVVMPESIR